MGGTISRSFHRVLGTIIGAPLGFLMGWAILQAGGPHEASRWVLMEVLFFFFMFVGVLVQQVPWTGYTSLIATLTVYLSTTAYFHTTLPHPPVYNLVTRLVFYIAACTWTCMICILLFPGKSVDNLEAALIDCMCTSGKAFATILHSGVIDENGMPECFLDEKTRGEVLNALKVLGAAQQNYAILLQDAFYEVWILKKRYHQYAAAVKQANEVSISVASLLFSYGSGFGQDVKEHIVVPTRDALLSAASPIRQKVSEMEALRFAHKNKTEKGLRVYLRERGKRLGKATSREWKENVEKAPPQNFKELLHDLTAARKNYWETHPVKELPPDMLHFCAFVNSAAKFVNDWEKLRRMVLHIKFLKELGVEALGKKEDIILENLPFEEEAPVILDLPYSTMEQERNQEIILSQENKGGYFG
eukprot:Phypoly_transcript_10771.p1 GENE.Phypoly_transcript_10771~~Phypoly_transcript_10771.p1  ORF type:complete len:417 (+),score=54.87 Phypoly_transcript_10771:2-1252(+)